VQLGFLGDEQAQERFADVSEADDGEVVGRDKSSFDGRSSFVRELARLIWLRR